MVSKLNTDKTYLEKDKFKSPKALLELYTDERMQTNFELSKKSVLLLSQSSLDTKHRFHHSSHDVLN